MLNAAFGNQHSARVDIYFNGNRQTNEQRFDGLKRRKEAIEAEIGESLVWQRLEHSKDCRISQVRDGGINDAPEALDELRKWMVKQLPVFRQVFGHELQKLAAV